MFAKTTLSIIIIFATASIGYIFAYRYVQRLKELKDFYLSLHLLETEIFYASNPLPIAMYRVGEKSSKSICKIFTDTYRILGSKMGHTIEEAWTMALDENFINTSLNDEDRSILIDFGKNLGSTDKENQRKNFQLAYLQLEKQQSSAEDLKVKNEKMCKNLGFLIGIAIVIVFI